jgi:tryptophan-rich sensory protein
MAGPDKRRATIVSGSRGDGGLSAPAAAALVAGAVALTAIVSKRYSPTPDHPDIERWYRSLEKPGFTPPDPVIGAGWGVAETLLAAGGYRLMRLPSSPGRNVALALWALNFATIAGWARLFFGERDLDGSLADIAVELGAAAGYVAVAARVDGTAAALGVPYAAWAAFGGALNEEIWRRNRGDGAGTAGARTRGSNLPALAH